MFCLVKAVRDKKSKNNVVTVFFLSVLFIFMIWEAGEVYKAIYRPVIRQYQGIYVRESHDEVDFVDLKKEDEEKTFYIAWLIMGKMELLKRTRNIRCTMKKIQK